jgi:hypothetical protein
MSTPLVVEYLRTHSTTDLMRDHGVKVSIGSRGYKASLNYDQIAAKESDSLANECRALVLATHDGRPWPEEGPVGSTIVLARAFDRFFNHGTGQAHPIDFDHPETRVFEKLDGTLILVYWDRFAEAWCVATRSVPDADKPLNGMALSGEGEWTFRSLFEMALRDAYGLSFDELTATLSPWCTYAYELTTPWNMIVVRHDRSDVHLLAVRRTVEGSHEVCPLDLPLGHPVRPCPSHPVRSLSDLFALLDARPPTESEGVVVRMAGFRRVKVKSAAYVAATRLKESVGTSVRSMLEVVLLNRDDDVMPLLPVPLQARLVEVRERFAALETRMDAAWPAIAASAVGDNPRKSVALAVKSAGLPIAPFMERYAGKVDSFRGWVMRAKTETGWSDSFLDSVLAMMGEEREAKAA